MEPRSLNAVYDGWLGYHRSIVAALQNLTTIQLEYRAMPAMRSVGELAWHIGDGRVDWFRRIGAPGSADLQGHIDARGSTPPRVYRVGDLVSWLDDTWKMVAATIDQWTVDDLVVSFEHPYEGRTYAVSRQWVIWRILTHDIHHGGQLSALLAMQGIEPVELTLLGGHLAEPPVVG